MFRVRNAVSALRAARLLGTGRRFPGTGRAPLRATLLKCSFRRASLPPSGPAADVASSALAVLSVPQVPRILHARPASAGATRHHTLLKGSEGAAPTTAAGVNHAPWPIDFGGGRASIHHNASCEREQGES